MKFITGSIDIRLSLEEVNTINDLIKRDTAKAIKCEPCGDTTLNRCPTCGKFIYGKGNFCEDCGQRLDLDNKAL